MDPYAVLRVPVDANADQIQSAYRRAVLRTHPDRGGKAEDFREVQSAFELLSDPAERLRYDRRRAAAQAWATRPSSPWVGSRPPGTWVHGQPWTPPGGNPDHWSRTYRMDQRPPTPPPARPAPVRNPWTAVTLSLLLLVVLSAGSGLGATGLVLLVLPLLALLGGRRWPRRASRRDRRQG